MYNYQCAQFSIRPFVQEDLSPLIKAANDPSIAQNTTLPYPFTKQDGFDWLKRESDLKKARLRGDINFAIIVDNKIAGSIGIKKLDDHRGEIGYWLAKPYRGQKIIQNALAQFANFAFSELGIVRLEAYTLPENIASQKVLENNHFIKEGLLHKYLRRGNQYFDCTIYSKLNPKHET